MADPALDQPPAADPATAMPSADEIKAWLDNNPDKAGTQNFVTMKQAYDAITATPAANAGGPRVGAMPAAPPPVSPAAANAALPGPRAGKDPRLMEPVAPDINYDVPIDQLRTSLAGVQNEPSRQAGLDRWADFQEQKENQQGGIWGAKRGVNDWIRAVASGVPGGAWADEGNAAVRSLWPNALGGMTYQENLALEQARNRRMAYEHPVASKVANIGGAVASAPLTAVRGAGILGNTAIDTGISFVQGAGDTPTGGDRLKSGAVDAAITAPISAAINAGLHSLNKYGVTSDNVVRAAEALGIDRLIPAFVRAASPEIQAAGRRTAQTSLDSPLNRAWQASRDATEQAGATAATRAIGPGAGDILTAPHAAGSQVGSALETVADAAQTQKGALARQSEELLPAGVRYDTPNMRANTDEVIAARAERGAVNPEAGLGDQLAMTTRAPPDPMSGPFHHYGPGGSTWPGMADQATEIGQRIGLPNTVPREVDNAQLGHIMRGLRNDQRSIMRQDAGPWGESMFTRNLERQGELSSLQQAIQDAMGKKPEDIVNMALNSATIKGAGTNLDALTHITGALTPEQRVQLGGGVLAKILNSSDGSMAKVASTLKSIPDTARARLFPPGTQLAADVEHLRTVAGRIGDVNALQGTGSSASLGSTMAIAGKYGGLGLGTGAALYGMHQGGYPELAVGGAAALAGGRYGFNKFAKPYLLQHGVTPAIQTGMDAARGFGRGIGTQYQLPVSEP